MKRNVALILFCLLVVFAPAAAQQKRGMAFEDIISLKGVSDPQISPDGRHVAYVVTSADLKENTTDADVWLAPAAGGTPIRLTTSKKNDGQPRWSPDGKSIAFISAREDKPQVFLISPFGGEAEKLTSSKTGVNSFAWSPDGSRVAYVAQEEPSPEEEKRMKEKDDAVVVDQEFKFTRIWLIEIATKKATELVKGDYVANDPQWSPDGRFIAYTTTPTPKADDGSLSDIRIIEIDSGKTRKLVENEGPDNAPRWSPDGKRIAFLTRENTNGVIGQMNLAIVPVEGGASRILTGGFEYQPGAATWSPDGRSLKFVSLTRTTTQLFSVDASGGNVRQITNNDGTMSPASFSRDHSVLAFTRSTVSAPNDVYAAELVSPTKQMKLSDHNPDIRSLALGSGEVIRWKSADGMEVEGVVIYPVGYEKGKRYPTIALIHGGPSGVWTQSFPGSYGNYGHVWAANGWVVFYPNVRGSSGYGEKFLLANVRDWGGGDYRDIQTGLDHLVAQGVSDPNRMAQSGWSYGGYMSAWTVTQTDRFKSIMVGAGLTNMYSMYSTNDLQRVLDAYFGGEPWDNIELYWQRSAMAFIKKAKSPTLIMHGAEDRRVPLGQAQELYMGLKKNDVPVQFVYYPREPHGLREPKHQMDKMRREYAWHSKYVLGIEVPEAPKEKKEKPEERPGVTRN